MSSNIIDFWFFAWNLYLLPCCWHTQAIASFPLFVTEDWIWWLKRIKQRSPYKSLLLYYQGPGPWASVKKCSKKIDSSPLTFLVVYERVNSLLGSLFIHYMPAIHVLQGYWPLLQWRTHHGRPHRTYWFCRRFTLLEESLKKNIMTCSQIL